jgi:hypothetical protein
MQTYHYEVETVKKKNQDHGFLGCDMSTSTQKEERKLNIHTKQLCTAQTLCAS